MTAELECAYCGSTEIAATYGGVYACYHCIEEADHD